jgi:DNA-binding MarR family transcriptional regulator/predicted GNAT family N-acyltransferase
MFLQAQGELALGSRFKAVSESLYGIANAAYRATGVTLDAHGFPVLRYLQVKGPAAVGDIAGAIGQTHSAVSQNASKLQRGGWLVRRADRGDGRRSLLALSAEGERRLGSLGPIWCAIRRGAQAAVKRSGGPLLDGLGKLESELADGSVLRDILAEHARLSAAHPVVKPFRAEWREHFHRINAEWLERDFAIEDVDRRVLSQPEKCIIEPGGAIMFALVDGEVIGTCALLKEAPGVYELTKMGVQTGWRGIGAGRLLLDATIAEFHKRRGKTLFLESNSRLTPALTMYESAGFVLQPGGRPGSHYQRSDVYMIYDAKRAGKAVSAAAKTNSRRASQARP